MGFQVGDKLKRVAPTSKSFTKEKYYEVQKIDGDNVVFIDDTNDEHWWGIPNLQGNFEVEPKQTKNQRITALEKEVAELKIIVEGIRKPNFLSAQEGVEAGKSITQGLVDGLNNIIEFEGAKYRKVEREAREGDVVRYKNTTSGQFSRDNFYKVLHPIAWSEGRCRVIGKDGDDYLLYQVGVGRTSNETDVYELIVEEKSKIQGITIELEQPKSPNQQRAEIIEKAKKFVESCKNKRGYYRNRELDGMKKHWGLIADFKVDAEKRTVVALMKGYSSFNFATKGIAKCNPSDVFNEHIGKAIALGRALGLDVSEFEQAVQPTEFEVGQTIKWDATGSKYDILNIDGHGYNFYSYLLKDELGMLGYENLKDLATIINDTNAQYLEEVK